MYLVEWLHRAKDSNTFGKKKSLHNKDLTFVYKFIYYKSKMAVQARFYICFGIKEIRPKWRENVCYWKTSICRKLYYAVKRIVPCIVYQKLAEDTIVDRRDKMKRIWNL